MPQVVERPFGASAAPYRSAEGMIFDCQNHRNATKIAPTMILYRATTTTRTAGIIVLITCSAIFTMAAFVGSFIYQDTEREAVLGLLIVIPLLLFTAYAISFSAYHIYRPQDTYVEITDETVSWKSWIGFGMHEESYRLVLLDSVGRPDEGQDYLKFLDGTMISLPAFIIPNNREFFTALREAAPGVVIPEECLR